MTDITERKTSEEDPAPGDANILGIFIGNLEGGIIEANDSLPERMVHHIVVTMWSRVACAGPI